MEDFEMTYADMADEELLALARSYDSLTDAAQDALRQEFARRGMEAPLVEEAGQDVQRRLVTVRRYRDLSEAIVARSMLESAGIPADLRDENLVRLDWQVSNFIGGMRLQVDSEDKAAALDLLAQPAPDAIEFEGAEVFLQPHCPVCASTNITFEGSSRGAALVSLYLLSTPLPFGHRTWRCESCGTRWEDDAEDPE